MTIDFSSELMKNQKHAVVMDPAFQFEVLQTQSGQSLFLSIGTDGVLYCTSEVQGTTEGWLRTDMSSVLSGQFSGAAVAVKLFDVCQNLTLGTLDIVAVVTVNAVDHLFVSLNNVNQSSFWSAPPPWQSVPYDDASNPQPALVAADVYVAESGPTEFIVIDIVQDASNPIKSISRYFIDPGKTLTGAAWNPHALEITLESDNIESRLGRKSHQLVDAMYTLGSLLGEMELIYSPLYNPFNVSLPPLDTRIALPAGAAPGETHFALSVNAAGTTDLFVAASGGLYFLASTAQTDGAAPVLVYSHPLLAGITSLHVNTNGNDVVVWGLNVQGQVFYVRNTLGSETTVPWSVPIPLLTGVDRVATYLNNVANNLVIFAQTSDETLVRLTQDPVTSLWQQHDILLPPTAVSDVVEYTTYTTHVQVTDDNKLPVPNQVVAITATASCSVYVNNRYYLLGTSTPVNVQTDTAGTVTIIQDVTGIAATYYDLAIDGVTVNVNPMANVIGKLSTVSSASDLNVTVTNEQGQQQPLVGPNVTDQQKNDTAAAIKQFVQISGTLPQDGSVKSTAHPGAARLAFSPGRDRIFGIDYSEGGAGYYEGHEAAAAAGLVFEHGRIALAPPDATVSSFTDPISAAAGDVFNWMKNAIDDVGHWFVTVVGDVANFLVNIADQWYHFVITCVNDIVNGIEFVLHKIEVLIAELIMWLGFLFGWGDIIHTHRVLKNVLKQFAAQSVAELGTAKQTLQGLFGNVQQEIDRWAGLPPISASIGSTSAQSSPLPGQNSPQSNWGVYHFKNNAGDAESSYDPAIAGSGNLMTMLGELETLLEAEGEAFLTAVQRLQTEVIAKLSELSATEVIQKLVAIVLDTLISTAENALLAVIDIIRILVSGVMDMVDASLDIPIISWIYKLVVGDDLSFLDAICLVAAIPITIIYKLIHGSAPFSGDDFTSQLVAAPDFATIRNSFPAQGAAAGASPVALGVTSLDPLTFSCNLMGVVGTVCVTFLAYAKASNPTSAMYAFLGGIAYLPYVAPNIPQMAMTSPAWYDKMNNVVTGIATAKSLVDIALYKTENTAVKAWSKCSPYLEGLINIVWQVPVTAVLVNSPVSANVIATFLSDTAFDLGGVLAMGGPSQLDAITICNIAYAALLAEMDIVG